MANNLNKFELSLQQHQELVAGDTVDSEELVDSLRILEDDAYKTNGNNEDRLKASLSTVINLSEQAFTLANVEPPLDDDQKTLLRTKIKVMSVYASTEINQGPTNTRQIKTGGVKK
jgi:hypothetical protein